ncbi:MAG: UDP-N-acetylglucosamine--N-acetylmuramyl-(pentapeptide) pyrophosphoryl-undecaprenol N-acetylglucosamine transferase, partial [Patescibacteria group bacterium]
GRGGHLYPLRGVADELIAETGGKIRLAYVGPRHSLEGEFHDRGIASFAIAGGKFRRYASLENLLDIPRLVVSFVQAFTILYRLMPDAVFSKGGTGALPVVVAAWFYLIPIVVHESDAIPGISNKLSAKLAKRIAISFRSAAAFFPPEKTAFVGNPVRRELRGEGVAQSTAKQTLGFYQNVPLALVLGGSQGSTRINTFVVDNLETLLTEVQIYHQTGDANLEEVKASVRPVMQRASEELQRRYRIVGSFAPDKLTLAFSAADVILSRAGAGAIYEIAAFQKPAILVPFPEAARNHQYRNATEYAATGAAIIVEESNFKPHLVLTELKQLLSRVRTDPTIAAAARSFFKPDAAAIIAREVLKLAKRGSPEVSW